MNNDKRTCMCQMESGFCKHNPCECGCHNKNHDKDKMVEELTIICINHGYSSCGICYPEELELAKTFYRLYDGNKSDFLLELEEIKNLYFVRAYNFMKEGYARTPKTLPNTNWQVAFTKEFCKHYEGILSEEAIKKSIQWNIDFMSPYMSQTLPNVKWPEPREHNFCQIGLGTAGCTCGADYANEMLNACKKAVGEAQPAGLVPLDEDEIRIMLIDAIASGITAKETRGFGKDISDIPRVHAKLICSKFGTPALPSVEELMDIISLYEGRDDLHDRILAIAIHERLKEGK